ncbi:MAG: 23S rRNA (adenine(2503)-C(2))-methyltransferase RlmN [Planctomycetes bacterium]|nr:23S rRNA (adenine(2503)-C(2))-methyltransferase RlmN [Planctomycetota bacterium]
MNPKPDLKGLFPQEIRDRLGDVNDWAPNLSKMVATRVHRDRQTEWSELNRIAPDRLAALRDRFELQQLRMTECRRSEVDGTRKYLFETGDGGRIETVLIPNREHNTLCVSSQVGCPLGCRFCATATIGYKRNLDAAEIVAQLYQVRSHSCVKITDVVFMGMGEPFLNYDNVVRAARLMNASYGQAIGRKHISISTSGVPHAIRRFADEGWQFRLLFSLHSADAAKRLALMPQHDVYPMDELLDAIAYYHDKMREKRWMILEYVAIPGVNMGDEDVEALERIVKSRGFKFLVNIIPFNPIGNEFRAPTRAEVKAFQAKLKRLSVPMETRYSGGWDIAAGCGQLAAITGAEAAMA